MSSLDDFLVLFLFLTVLPIGTGFFAALATPMLLPIYPAALAAGTLQGIKNYFGVIAGFVVSFALFALLFSIIIYYLYLPQEVVRISAIIVSVSFGLLMIFSKGLYDNQRILFFNGFFYGALLGFVWSFWVGPFMPQLDYYAPTSVDFYLTCLTFMFGVGAGLFILIISYLIHKIIYWTKLSLKNINILRKILGSLMVLINLAIVLGWFTIPKRDELKHPEPYVPLNEIFQLKKM